MADEKDEDVAANAFESGYCVGMMSGIGAVLQINCFDKSYKGKFATAMNTNNGQRIRAFLNWADEHPELWTEMDSYALLAIATKLPCTK